MEGFVNPGILFFIPSNLDIIDKILLPLIVVTFLTSGFILLASLVLVLSVFISLLFRFLTGSGKLFFIVFCWNIAEFLILLLSSIGFILAKKLS